MISTILQIIYNLLSLKCKQSANRETLQPDRAIYYTSRKPGPEC